jgi:hypothetical protein
MIAPNDPMTFTPSDLRAAADREDDPALAAMLRQGADAMRERDAARDALINAGIELHVARRQIAALAKGNRDLTEQAIAALDRAEPLMSAIHAAESLINIIGQYGLFMGAAWRTGDGSEIMDVYQAAYDAFQAAEAKLAALTEKQE